MNTTFLRTTFSMTLLIATNLAFADDHRKPSLDDKVNRALSLSREIRVEIRNDFVQSTSYQHLLSDSAQLQSSVRIILESIRCNKPVDVICHQIDQTQRELRELTVCLETSDFATVRTVRHHSGFRPSEYARRDMGRHPGYAHYLATVEMINELKSTLDCLHDDLPRVSSAWPRPVPRPAPLPTHPEHWNGGRPIGNHWTVPSAGLARPAISTSVNLGSRGELVFRVPLD